MQAGDLDGQGAATTSGARLGLQSGMHLRHLPILGTIGFSMKHTKIKSRLTSLLHGIWPNYKISQPPWHWDLLNGALLIDVAPMAPYPDEEYRSVSCGTQGLCSQ